MRITSSLFEAFLNCPTKCFLRSLGEPETGNSFADWIRRQDESYRNEVIRHFTEWTEHDECVFHPLNIENLKTSQWRVAVDVLARTQCLESSLHAVEQVPSKGRSKHGQFIPIRFIYTNKLTKQDKLRLAFDALVLSEVLGCEAGFGKIIHGDSHATTKVKTAGSLSEVRKLTGKIVELLSSSSPPDLVLNRHCAACEFQARCRQKAIEKDDLSLLSNMTEKERKTFNSKGIFTVT